MARVEICVRCGRKWPVSACADTKGMYLCPECEERILGRKVIDVVWLDEEAARLRN